MMSSKKEKMVKAIAIDGPAASGKTTIGHMLAKRMDYLLLDTGCMYRAVTLAALQRGIDINHENSVSELAKQLKLDIRPAGEATDERLYTVLLDGVDVTWHIRSSSVDAYVSKVSSYRDVRKELVRRQREIAHNNNVVVVGRDIGTVVLPDAPLKLYIIASAEERADRRWLERKNRDPGTSFEEILSDIKRRDAFDGHRRYSPMKPAKDAIIIDTTDRSPDDILAQILELDHFKLGELSG